MLTQPDHNTQRFSLRFINSKIETFMNYESQSKETSRFTTFQTKISDLIKPRALVDLERFKILNQSLRAISLKVSG